MDYEKYKVTLSYPPRPTGLGLPDKNWSPDQFREHARKLEAHEKEMKAYRKETDKYHAEQARQDSLFKADALEDVGLAGHPKAEKAWALAWENGHSGGYSDVYSHLVDYADLLNG